MIPIERPPLLSLLASAVVAAPAFLAISCATSEANRVRTGDVAGEDRAGDVESTLSPRDYVLGRRRDAAEEAPSRPPEPVRDGAAAATDTRGPGGERSTVPFDDSRSSVTTRSLDASSDRQAARRRGVGDDDGDDAPAGSVVEQLIADLKASAPRARQAFGKLTVIDAKHIPELIEYVTSEERSKLEDIKIFVANRNYVRHAAQFLASEIPGMGALEEFDEQGRGVPTEYTKKSVGPARNKRGYRVEMTNFYGFKVGVVVRAALRNRILLALLENRVESLKYPEGIDHRRHLLSWWRAFHATYANRLELR